MASGISKDETIQNPEAVLDVLQFHMEGFLLIINSFLFHSFFMISFIIS